MAASPRRNKNMKQRVYQICLLIFFILPTAWAAERHEETYKPVDPPQPTQTGNKIEVIEIFWYGCPHCYAFEPYVDHWLKSKSDDIEFRRMPAILGKNWIVHAKAYYTAETLGVLDKIHRPLFDALHKNGEPINDEKRLRKFFIKHGVDGDEFSKIFSSKETDDKIKNAFVMGQRYRITGVPAVIINGKYRTSTSVAGSFSNIIDTINQLAERERKNATAEE